VAVCSLFPGVLFAADPAPQSPTPAPEKIQFSDPADNFTIPTQDVDGVLSKKPFESLNRESSMSGVITPNLTLPNRPAPSGGLDPRMIELYQRRLDERRNWIFQRPDDAENELTLEERFGVRDNSRIGGSRSRSVLMEFFETPSRKSSSSRSPDSSRDEMERNSPLNSWDSGSRFSETGSGARGPADVSGAGRSSNPLFGSELNNPGFSVQGGFMAPDPMRPDASLDPAFRANRGREGEKLSRADEFRKLLVIQNGINPLAAGFDPINLRVDVTRQALNPVTPVGLDLPVVGAGVLAAPGAATSIGRDTSLLEPNARLAGSSSLAPAVPTPAASPRQLRQPAVLEMPRRKF